MTAPAPGQVQVRGQKYLHELLQVDQEPFLLRNYIAEKRCQLKRSASAKPTTTTAATAAAERETAKVLQLKKYRRPLMEKNSKFPGKKFCFLSSPDVRKSPLFEPPSMMSPSSKPTSSKAIFLHVPQKTASLLLDAALRIQKQRNKNSSFGLLGSMLKKLTHKNRSTTTRKPLSKQFERAPGDKDTVVSIKDILRWESSKNLVQNEEKIETLMVLTRSNDNDGMSSGLWSETNEETSLDCLNCCSYCQSEDDDDDVESKSSKDNGNEFGVHSPFHFVLQKSPSSGHRTPVFSSPAMSPTRHQVEDKINYGGEEFKTYQTQEEDEEKEQCSPVSVLDTPFEDNDGHEDEDDIGSFDMECSYAIVQRAKQQLLHKLRRFEKLAQLDPLELEERLLEDELEQDDDEEYDYDLDDDLYEDGNSQESESALGDTNADDKIEEILQRSGFQNVHRVPADMKRLVSDLIAEENREETDNNEVLKMVCRRLDSWKEVKADTIDMMVEIDFRRELDGWKKNQEQIGEASREIEQAIFGALLNELSEDLVCLIRA